MAAQVLSHTEGSTLVLTLSNPGFRNALGPEMYAAGVEALHAAESQPHIRSVLITGEGDHFSAGGNLGRLMERRSQPRQVQADSIDALHRWIEALVTCPKPVIAAVEGAAAGAGFSLALACDHIVAAENARFVMAYSNVGLSPDGGGSWFLSRLLPRQLVSAALMLGDTLSAAELQQHGILRQVVPAGQAEAAGLELAAQLAKRPANVLASIKQLVREAQDQPLSRQLDLERSHFVDNLHHENGGIGIQAFLNKQTPQYR